jgi:hypothetical protein
MKFHGDISTLGMESKFRGIKYKKRAKQLQVTARSYVIN